MRSPYVTLDLTQYCTYSRRENSNKFSLSIFQLSKHIILSQQRAGGVSHSFHTVYSKSTHIAFFLLIKNICQKVMVFNLKSSDAKYEKQQEISIESKAPKPQISNAIVSASSLGIESRIDPSRFIHIQSNNYWLVLILSPPPHYQQMSGILEYSKSVTLIKRDTLLSKPLHRVVHSLLHS